MKIESSNLCYRNRTISFCDGIKVSFDGLGCAEIEEEDAKILLDTYKGMICEAGKAAKKNVKKVETDTSAFTIEIDKLKNEVLVKDEKIKDLETNLNEEKATSTNWKNLYDEAEKDANKNELTEQIKVLEAKNELLGIKCDLFQKNKAELIEVALQLEIPKEDYKDLKVDELVNLLLTKLKQ